MPKSQFKVQDIENCTRKGSAQRGRAIVHMISRHFDLDRFRGSLNTSQSVFAVELHGYAVSDLQEFPSQLMKVLNRLFRAVATPAIPPKCLGPKPSEVKALPANPKSNAKAGLKASGKSKRKARIKMAEGKANVPCVFHEKPSVCSHSDKYEYSHAASAKAPPPKARAEVKRKPKPKASGPFPKVAAVVALVTAMSSLVCPSHALESLEWATGTGAGRHLVSCEALQDQGFDRIFIRILPVIFTRI